MPERFRKIRRFQSYLFRSHEKGWPLRASEKEKTKGTLVVFSFSSLAGGRVVLSYPLPSCSPDFAKRDELLLYSCLNFFLASWLAINTEAADAFVAY